MAEQLKSHQAELGMEGKSLSLKSRKDKESLSKISQSIEEVKKYDISSCKTNY